MLSLSELLNYYYNNYYYYYFTFILVSIVIIITINTIKTMSKCRKRTLDRTLHVHVLLTCISEFTTDFIEDVELLASFCPNLSRGRVILLITRISVILGDSGAVSRFQVRAEEPLKEIDALTRLQSETCITLERLSIVNSDHQLKCLLQYHLLIMSKNTVHFTERESFFHS